MPPLVALGIMFNFPLFRTGIGFAASDPLFPPFMRLRICAGGNGCVALIALPAIELACGLSVGRLASYAHPSRFATKAGKKCAPSCLLYVGCSGNAYVSIPMQAWNAQGAFPISILPIRYSTFKRHKIVGYWPYAHKIVEFAGGMANEFQRQAPENNQVSFAAIARLW